MKRKFYNCMSCNEDDTYDNMVCCDHCDEWHHYKCAGVQHEIKNLKWSCQRCLEIFTVKAEKKIINSEIETVPDLWIRGGKTTKYILCPPCFKKQAFLTAVRNYSVPNETWRKIRCQVLESKFKTYNLAKAAEDSIVRNLELQKRTDATDKRVRVVDEPVVIQSENEDLDKLILTKIESALAKLLQIDGSNSGELEKVISSKIESAIVRRIKGAESNETSAVDDVGACASHVVEGTCASDVIEGACASDVVEGACASDVIEGACASDIVEGACASDVVEGTCASDAIEGACASYVDEGPSAFELLQQSNTSVIVQPTAVVDVCVSGQMKLPVRKKEQVPLLNDYLHKNFKYVHQVHRSKGGNKKLATTMRIICGSIIDDSALKEFSFEGRRGKWPIKIHTKVVDLIVECTRDAHNDFNAHTKNFVPVTKKDVEDYFKNNFIKYASQRI